MQTMSDHPGRVQAASLLVILSSVLFGLLRLMRERGTVLRHMGVGLALLGVIGHAVWAGFEVVLVWMANSAKAQARSADQGRADLRFPVADPAQYRGRRVTVAAKRSP